MYRVYDPATNGTQTTMIAVTISNHRTNKVDIDQDSCHQHMMNCTKFHLWSYTTTQAQAQIYSLSPPFLMVDVVVVCGEHLIFSRKMLLSTPYLVIAYPLVLSCDICEVVVVVRRVVDWVDTSDIRSFNIPNCRARWM